ncbi:MAG: metallophosphoesterase [Candidatus Kapabacteria bacterium]|nr:metallophosphoesterase [Candidatus Kapabacteria bacterium]
MSNSNRSYVIGDIHGCAKTFRELVFNQLHVMSGDYVYLLGDLIDRGPDSKSVLDTIFELISKGIIVKSIIGNHEQLLLDAIDYPYKAEAWLSNGGFKTLDSFDLINLSQIDSKYYNFIKNMSYYIILEKFVLVHAGLDFEADDIFRDKSTMLWLRSTFCEPDKIGGRRLIVGHTPKYLNQISSSINDNLIYLDGGCVYNTKPGLGNLVALDTGAMKLYVQNNIDI